MFDVRSPTSHDIDKVKKWGCSKEIKGVLGFTHSPFADTQYLMLRHPRSYWNITAASHGDGDVGKMAEEKTGKKNCSVCF